MILTSLALATAAAFAGAAFYVGWSEQPARLALDDVSLLKEWKPSYAKGFQMQATLAVVSGVLGLLAVFESGLIAVIGGLLMLANWPYTLMRIAPTNKILEETAEKDAGPATRALIEQWAQLHAVRTGLGIAGTVAFVLASIAR